MWYVFSGAVFYQGFFLNIVAILNKSVKYKILCDMNLVLRYFTQAASLVLNY